MISITIPVMRPARTARSKNACETNLEQIQDAIRSWSMSEKKSPTDKVVIESVVKSLRGGMLPKCPAGGSYEVLQVKDQPTCTLASTLGHSIHK